jgi:hypothetical protein
MGLDIRYYKNITKLDCVFDADGEPLDAATKAPLSEKHFWACVNPHFPERADGLDSKSCYSYEESEGFRAGSYSGYNHWRETLAQIAGYPAIEDERHGVVTKRHDKGAYVAGNGPFFELIWFSDCEGIIGPKTSAKLAKDFATFSDAVAASATDEWFKEKYAEWKTAFETAAQNGAVRFH